MTVYKISGKVVRSDTKEGINGLRVEAWDKDLLVNDLVGSAITGEGGIFRIQFDETYFKELFLDRSPDLFFKIYKGSSLIKSTEDSVLWNVDREDIEQTIEVKEVSDMPTSKNKTIRVKQRGSEIFKFVTIRPFQRQDESEVEKKKVLCYNKESKSELHQRLCEAKNNPPEGSGPREAMLAVAIDFIADSPNFVRNIHELWKPSAARSSAPAQGSDRSALGILEEWIFRNKKPISYDNLLSEILATYNNDNINDIVQSYNFQTDIDNLRDSIMALAIVPSAVHLHRDRLVNALRICRIIERMARIEQQSDADEALQRSYGVERAVKAPVVLPTNIFPLPPAKKIAPKITLDQKNKHEEELQSLREKRNALKKAIDELEHVKPEDYAKPPRHPSEKPPLLKKEDIQKLSTSTNALCKEIGLDLTRESIPEVIIRLETERVRAEEAKATELKSAMDELQKLATSRLSEYPKLPAAVEEFKPWILKPEAIGRLGETTQKTIQEIGFDLGRDPIPQIINTLEKELVTVGAQLFIPPRRKKIILRGTSRFEFLPGIETSPWLPRESESDSVPELECKVEPVGIGEYNSVRQTLLNYESGEVAHIENVLRGEYKERIHRRLHRVEEELTYEEERNTTTERDLESTDRFELKREASETIKEDIKIDGRVTARYGTKTTFVEGNIGASYAHAKEQSKKTSVSYARDVTQRSTNKLEEKIREVRTQKTLDEFEETNTHGIDNKGQPDHAIGIYRWVDKIYEAQVVGYGERLFFDFVIPEPAAFYLYALTHGADTDLEEPVPPMTDKNGEPCGEDDQNARPLKPDDIERSNYQGWLSYYNATGIKPYPETVKIVAKSWKAQDWKSMPEENAIMYELAEVLQLDDGYKAESAYAILNFPKTSGMCLVQDNLVARITIGYQTRNLRNCVSLVSYPDHDEYKYWFKVEIDNLNEQGSIPFSASFITKDQLHDYDSIHSEDIGPLSLEIKCVSSDEKRKSWQLETYDAIMQAYYKQKADYEEKLAAAAIQEGISISGRNPGQNREIIETELKKWALSMITGQYFELFNAMDTDPKDEYPGVDFAEAKEEESLIRFFEQTFEWPLMTYLFYPYFWGKREASWDGGPTWVDKITNIQDVDPLFERFLKAGAARITVPVRPGFEEAIGNYVSTGEIWNGGEVPTIDDDLYLSIVEEIQQMQGAYIEKSEGAISVENGNDQVFGIGTNFEESDVDHEIYIERKRYIIAEVQDSENLTLTEEYREENQAEARYYIGAKLVGGPWEVRVPTSLVYLQEDATLPEYDTVE